MRRVIVLSTLLVTVGASTSAFALNTRTWISGTGVDQAGCGPIATPCRTLQYAHDQTSSGGEIDVKDSAGYGSVVITKAINIVGDGSLAGVLAPATGNGITINAGGADKIILRGLTIEGAAVGYNGIVFNSGGALDVANCVIQNFVGTGPAIGNGILLAPASGAPVFTIADTNLSYNGFAGLNYYPATGSAVKSSLVIDHVISTSNPLGILVNTPTISGVTSVTVSNSISAKNDTGIYLSGSLIKADIDLSHADQNRYNGYHIVSGTVTIGRSVGANNGQYGLNNAAGTVSSYGDNRFAGNGSGATSGTIEPAVLH